MKKQIYYIMIIMMFGLLITGCVTTTTTTTTTTTAATTTTTTTTTTAISTTASTLPIQNVGPFTPGTTWNDTAGVPIAAHEGGIIYQNGTYYWYGINTFSMSGNSDLASGNPLSLDLANKYSAEYGVTVYSSTDLLHWQNDGIALSVDFVDQTNDLFYTNTLNRPHVIYNDSTGLYVMYMHIDNSKGTYSRAGIAVSNSPTGPFIYLKSINIDGPGINGGGAGMVRDLYLFKDTDGTAYLVFDSENDATIYCAKLSSDYLTPTGDFVKIATNAYREAPVLFKYDNQYYLMTSGETGYSPNAAVYYTASSILGTWTSAGNPFVGDTASVSFNSQPTDVIPVQGLNDAFIYIGDRWNSTDLSDSQYVFLPFAIQDGKVQISWEPSWSTSIFN